MTRAVLVASDLVDPLPVRSLLSAKAASATGQHGRQVTQLPPSIFPIRTGTGGLRFAASEATIYDFGNNPSIATAF